MMKIYTKKGDKGQTALFGGAKVGKEDIRLHAYGTTDELNSLLGMILAQNVSNTTRKILLTIQEELFVLGSDLATPLPKKGAIDRLQAPAQFESWLFRLARNTCIDQLRRQKLRRIFLPFGEEHENIPEPPGAVDSEELDALRHALAQLRPQDRALLALVRR